MLQKLFPSEVTGILPRPTLVFGAVLPLLIIEIISAVGSIGKGVAIDKLNNAKWRRLDLPMIGRLVMCQGIGVLLNGLTGTSSTGYLERLDFSSNIEASRIFYHRYIVDISESRTSLTGG